MYYLPKQSRHLSIIPVKQRQRHSVQYQAVCAAGWIPEYVHEWLGGLQQLILYLQNTVPHSWY